MYVCIHAQYVHVYTMYMFIRDSWLLLHTVHLHAMTCSLKPHLAQSFLWWCVSLQGVVQEQREVFELASDEDRLCSVCSTYCFLSAVRCPCNPSEWGCVCTCGVVVWRMWCVCVCVRVFVCSCVRVLYFVHVPY